MIQNEKIIKQLLQKNSIEAFEMLYSHYSGKLYHFLLKLSHKDTYLAEEITQRVFIKIWENRSLINPEKSFISYLCTIAKNMLINEYEHQTVKFIYQEYISTFSATDDNSTEKEINVKILEERINALTELLPPARRQIFILSKMNMLSNKEIAEKLQLSENTIQTQLSKALKFMKDHLSNYGQLILSALVCLFVK